jgi:hypothetical protein
MRVLKLNKKFDVLKKIKYLIKLKWFLMEYYHFFVEININNYTTYVSN